MKKEKEESLNSNWMSFGVSGDPVGTQDGGAFVGLRKAVSRNQRRLPPLSLHPGDEHTQTQKIFAVKAKSITFTISLTSYRIHDRRIESQKYDQHQ